jgi:hypothetical protein
VGGGGEGALLRCFVFCVFRFPLGHVILMAFRKNPSLVLILCHILQKKKKFMPQVLVIHASSIQIWHIEL